MPIKTPHSSSQNRAHSAFWRLLMVVLLVLTANQFAQASSIRQLHFDDLGQQAELIFAGEVVQSVAAWNQQRSRISTEITFRVDEVIKGSYPQATLVLRFAGGTVGEATMKYEGLRYPAMGESGIYFIETLARPLVNPLVGWSQGHFLLDDQQRVITADGRPIATIQQKTSDSQSTNQLSRGVAQGLTIGDEQQAAIPKAEFIQLIKQRIE